MPAHPRIRWISSLAALAAAAIAPALAEASEVEYTALKSTFANGAGGLDVDVVVRTAVQRDERPRPGRGSEHARLGGRHLHHARGPARGPGHGDEHLGLAELHLDRAAPESAALSLARKATIGGLLSVGGSAGARVQLEDETAGTTTTLANEEISTADTSFVTHSLPINPSLLKQTHSYRLLLTTNLSAAALLSGIRVAYDDVALTVTVSGTTAAGTRAAPPAARAAPAERAARHTPASGGRPPAPRVAWRRALHARPRGDAARTRHTCRQARHTARHHAADGQAGAPPHHRSPRGRLHEADPARPCARPAHVSRGGSRHHDLGTTPVGGDRAMHFRAATPPHQPAPDAEEALAGTLPLRRRLLFGALLAGLALVGVAGGLAWHQYDDARRIAVNDARARVILAGTIIDTYFSGELATLASIAQSASCRRVTPPRCAPTSSAFSRRRASAFTGGLGWIDRNGIWRVSGDASPTVPLDLSDRSYVKTVMATGAPFVSEGIAARRTGRQIIVLAVPTRDASGRLTGVLAGSMLVNTFQAPGGSADLGFAGLAVLDRRGRAVLAGFTRPRNVELQERLRQSQVGLLSSTHGLDGQPDHLVAYATAQVPGWTIAIDRPRSAVFAAARRGLVLELALIAIAAAIVFSVIGWTLLRTRRDAELQSARARLRGELSHALGEARLAAEVSDGLANGLAAAFPGASAW